LAVKEAAETGRVIAVGTPFCRMVICAATSVDPHRSADMNPLLALKM